VYVKITLKPHISLTNERKRPQAKRALEFMLMFYVAAEFKVNLCVLQATHTEWFKIAEWDLERSHCPAICSEAGTAAFPDRMTFRTYVYLTSFSDEDYSTIICCPSPSIQKCVLVQLKSLLVVQDKLFPSSLWKPFTHLKAATMSPLHFILSSRVLSFFSSCDTLQLGHVFL